MTVTNISADLMREALTELTQASYNHEQWAEKFHGTLISRGAPDQKDIRADAHRNCRFGQWYYGAEIAALRAHPGFAAIGVEHDLMHRLAANLLRSSTSGSPISNEAYESFVATRKRLVLEIATVRHEFEEELNGLDPLTGTPGRIGMLSKLRDQREMAARSIQTCVIAMMDLDLFKTVNDRFGHLVGDKVLIDIARHVASHLRTYDKVYRYGGEEFLICLPGTDESAGRGIIDRLRAELADLRHEAAGREPFQVTVSFGYAVLDPTVPVEQSIDRADKALYAAKKAGRNCVVAWNKSMDAEAG
jgi:diguanylate cyclase (GGDEF)-like protein